jgi:hypothetical protein
MVIGAMDLLHRAGIAHFCLVSSDSDFSGLALHLREAGCTVYCVGRATASAALRSAYRRFITIESLMPAPPQPVTIEVPGLPGDLHRLIDAAISASHNDNGRVRMSELGVRLREKRPGFKAASFGHKTLTELVRHLGGYAVTTSNGAAWIAPKANACAIRH